MEFCHLSYQFEPATVHEIEMLKSEQNPRAKRNPMSAKARPPGLHWSCRLTWPAGGGAAPAWCSQWSPQHVGADQKLFTAATGTVKRDRREKPKGAVIGSNWLVHLLCREK